MRFAYKAHGFRLSLSIYRSVKEIKEYTEQVYHYRDTISPPGNIPCIVDNLLELARPDNFPSCRHVAYASPTQHLALQSGPKGGSVYHITFLGEVKIAQLKGYSDSKEHPGCKVLIKPSFTY